MTPRVIQIVALVTLAGGLGTMVYALAAQPQLLADRFGLRGVRRQRALEAEGLFTTFEPLVRWLGARLAPIPLAGLRARLDHLLVRAGYWYGVSPDELIGMSLLSAIGLSGAGALICSAGDLPGVTLLFFAGLGAILPYTNVTGRAAARQKTVDRGLPAAIDLAALCMGAGLDFTATLRQLAEKSGRPEDPIVEEIDIVISHLMLGVTRQRALIGLAERVPTDAVRQLVAAVIQSEEKGNPLAETLKLQAATLRLRRSVRGEEAASRAAVMMMAPLMLIMGAIVLVVLGPFVVRGYLGS